MLKEPDMFCGEIDKVKIAIERLKTFEPPKGYYLAFSGGKDSQVIYDLAVKSGVKFDAHFNVTTIDAPELLRFIKANYPDVKWEYPEINFWQLMLKKRMPPTRRSRYCCEYLKERGGGGRLVITGVRRAESAKRSTRAMTETCYNDKTKKFLNVIIDWKDKDVWEYIKGNKLSYCSLYDEGWKRIGCIGCPMSYKRKSEFERYPRIKNKFKKTLEKIIIWHKERPDYDPNCVFSSLKTMWAWYLDENPELTPEELEEYENQVFKLE